MFVISRLLRAALLALTAVALPSLATAQTYPSRSETAVTDDAELIAPVAEAELALRLMSTGQANNAEIVVVTLPSMAPHTAGEDIDAYARGLMDAWDLGDTVGGRGVLILVFATDRELRIETGAGFGTQAAAVAAAIVTDALVPPLQADDYTTGFNDALTALEDRLLGLPGTVPERSDPATGAAPDAAAEAAPGTGSGTGPDADTDRSPDTAPDTGPVTAEEGGTNILLWAGGGIAAFIALIVGLNRRAAAKLAATPCPACGKTGLTRERVTLRQATEDDEGHGEVRTTCPHCGHEDAAPFTLRRRAADTSGKKGPGAKAGAGGPAVHGTMKGGPGPKGKPGGGGASGEF